MNLVIDDAVEVKLAQKDQQEARRSLGDYILAVADRAMSDRYRSNTAQRRQCFAHSGTTMMNLHQGADLHKHANAKID